jgi:hypothetical protein
MKPINCQPILFALMCVIATRYAPAQGGLRQHEVGFGITISLPGTWVAADDSALARASEWTREAMRGSPLKALRQVAAQNQNTVLFQAADSLQQWNSVNMNVTVDGATPTDAFSAASPEEVAAVAEYLCEQYDAHMRAYGMATTCTSHEVMTLENRGVLVVHQEMTMEDRGVDNRRTIALIPSHGMLFTLSLSVAKADYDSAEVRAILASVRLPAGI